MRVIAGAAAIVFGVIHGAPALAGFGRPTAAPGSHDPGAVPRWARALWILLAAGAVVAAVFYLVGGGVAGAAAASACAIGIWLLAIANGFWIHGRPTISHHRVRAVMVALVVALLFAGAK
jgi:hypothetical protein